ncbi:MAG: PEGA domain-containing protein [Bdellovibrionaceae bacterium]|nr:PEGA domain-containing protein [Pseudobdellovibrionaceae bacterium]
MSTFIVLIALVFQISGCATIINGSVESIEIYSTAENTNVYVNDEYLGQAGPQTPLEITIPKRGQINIVGKKEECREYETEIKRTIDPTTLLGVFIDGGIVSILLIDNLGTGAIKRAREISYTLEMVCRT